MDRAIRYIEREAEEISFSGVISMEMGNGDRYCKGFGCRDRKNGEPNTPATKFGIASGTKLFTALGIGRLVDLGRISLTTAFGSPDATPAPVSTPCTPWTRV